MAFPFRFRSYVGLSAAVLVISSSATAYASNFKQDVDITWGNGRAKILNSGQLLILALDKFSGSGFQSKNKYLYGNINMQIKLVPGNSAGTVTAYFLRTAGALWDEIDFEFLGNESGQPYTVHTNIYSKGKGDREQQFRLWFDPTADFHTYSFSWNPRRIIFSVDGTPIREFKNMESIGVPFPKGQAMRLYSSLWCADNWATRGGLVKTDWNHAPFTAQYRNFNANSRTSQEPGATRHQRLAWVRKNYMIYNYCNDRKRFPHGLPKECTVRGSSS